MFLVSIQMNKIIMSDSLSERTELAVRDLKFVTPNAPAGGVVYKLAGGVDGRRARGCGVEIGRR